MNLIKKVILINKKGITKEGLLITLILVSIVFASYFTDENGNFTGLAGKGTTTKQCSNGIDDDFDGLTDSADPGCTYESREKNGEKGSGTYPGQCDDAQDNDGDGFIDYRIDGKGDLGCTSAFDTNELDPAACEDGKDNDNDGKTDYPADPGCNSVTDTSELGSYQCDNGIDDDNDGFIDMKDPECSSLTDNSEQPTSTIQCNDRIDNDNDGKIDYPADPDCSSLTDNSEQHMPLCEDNIDNDNDGKIDYPADPGCSSYVDETEEDITQCNDRIDNDLDGKIDYPNDPDCASLLDNSESVFCTDTDGGQDLFVKGGVTASNIATTYYDTCIKIEYADGSIQYGVNEVYCQDNSATVQKFECPDYYYCNNGACEPKNCQAGYACLDGSVAGYLNTNCKWSNTQRCSNGCSNGVCIGSDSCSDSDGGKNYNTQGITSGINGGNSYSYTDSCSSSILLLEWYCSGTNPSSITFDCNSNSTNKTCSSGTCQ